MNSLHILLFQEQQSTIYEKFRLLTEGKGQGVYAVFFAPGPRGGGFGRGPYTVGWGENTLVLLVDDGLVASTDDGYCRSDLE